MWFVYAGFVRRRLLPKQHTTTTKHNNALAWKLAAGCRRRVCVSTISNVQAWPGPKYILLPANATDETARAALVVVHKEQLEVVLD
jgi:hypothetical protein